MQPKIHLGRMAFVFALATLPAAVTLAVATNTASAAKIDVNPSLRPIPVRIALNGRVVERVEGRIGKDPWSHHFTSWIPLFSVDSLLHRAGWSAAWNGQTHTWGIAPPQGLGLGSVPLSSLAAAESTSKSRMAIRYDGVTVYYAPRIVSPNIGFGGAETTFMPTYYLQQALARTRGMSCSWNGNDNTLWLNVPVRSNGLTYDVYHNQLYNYTVQYPATWLEGPGATNGGGRMFAPNRSALEVPDLGISNESDLATPSLVASGNSNDTIGIGQGISFIEMAEEIQAFNQSLRTKPGYRYIHTRIADRKYVVTTSEREIKHTALRYVLQYTTLSWNESLTFTVPLRLAKRDASIWQHIEATFVFGNELN